MKNKITYTDDEGKERSLDENLSRKTDYYNQNIKNSKTKDSGNIFKRQASFIVFFLILSFVMGFLGGTGAIVLLSSQSKVRGLLGLNIKEIEIPKIKGEKIVLEESSAVIDAVKKVSPSVVSISAKISVEDIFGRQSSAEGGATGFIITNDGLILTNKHVVSDKNASYTVFTADGKSYDAKILSVDPFNDLAVIKIEASGLPVVELGDSDPDKLQIGQHVIAIGNALGEFRNTVTLGVISAVERTLEASDPISGETEKLEGLLQTDAAVNEGNSGGPLVNLKGQVVGINTAIASKGVAEGLGFAIPIDVAKSAIESVKSTGKIIRPMLGVRYAPINSEIAKAANLPVDYGVLVRKGDQIGQSAVIAGSPADKAGISENDIITYINGEKIDENHSLSRLIQQYQPGDEVELTIISNKQEKKVKVKLAEFE